MAFGVAQVVTDAGKAVAAKRLTGGGSPSQAEPKYMAIGNGATSADRTANVSDTALSVEVDRQGTNNGTTVTTAVTDDTYQVVQTFVATGNVAVDEFALFDANTSGNMFVSGTMNPVNLVENDALQLTVAVQFVDPA